MSRNSEPRQTPVAHACNPSYSEGSWFEASLGKSIERPYLEIKSFTKKKKRVGEWLKVKALRSSPSTEKKVKF
jgi:hypothetical protein